jgi:hypothetical protein
MVRISKSKKAELFNLYKDFIKEFSINGFKNILPYSKRIYYPLPGKENNRYTSPNGPGFRTKTIIEQSLMTGFLREEIKKFDSTKPLFDFIKENDIYPYNIDSFEKDSGGFPSIIERFISGFITRMYEINNFQFIITEESFNQTFNELIDFINTDVVSIKFLANIIGPIGEVDAIILNDNIRILKGDYNISNLFCTHYASSDFNTFNQVEMFENDYYVEYIHNTKKNEISSVNAVAKNIDNVFRLFSIVSAGTIEKGKIIRVGNSWPLSGNGPWTVNHPYGHKRYSENKFPYEFNEKNIERLKYLFSAIGLNIFANLESSVEKSFQRLLKSKSTFVIEDKLIDLVLAIEYLINTNHYEVTLQICLKMIKLSADSNIDDEIFGKLKKFFSLRGAVFHGRSEEILNKKNIELITFTENVLLQIMERILIDFKDYTLNQINDATDKSLYMNKKIIEILRENNLN